MGSFIALRKTFDLSSDNNSHLLCGRQNRDFPVVPEGGAVMTTLKKHYDFTVNVSFNPNGGTTCSPESYTLGGTYKSLPTPTKTQHVFSGWYTQLNGGRLVSDSSTVELSNTVLYAHWEEVNITGSYTSYKAVATSSFKNTGIYVASRYTTSEPVYIDWGDGAVEKVDRNISQKAHTYASAGTYIVKVSNNLTSFAPSYNDSTWYTTISNNRYTFKEMLTTGSRVSVMPAGAFCYCAALSTINWLSSCWTSITSIPASAFYYCTGFNTLSNLPARIKTIDTYGFGYCQGLTGIQDLRSTGLTSLYAGFSFYFCDQVKEWKLPTSLSGTRFGSWMFAYNSTLSAVELPTQLTSIASNCFQDDLQLKQITIPAKVAIINPYAFAGCQTLSSTTYQTTALTAINSHAFQNCYALTNINVPQTVKTIGSYAFYNCRHSSAKDLTLPSALASLNTNAYQGCYSLRSITIQSALTSIGDYAFAGCYNVSSIVDHRLTAQTVAANTFGNSASTDSSSGYTGYSTRGSNVLCTYVVADGYDSSYWNDSLQTSGKCGFKQVYIDPENLKYCTVTFDPGDGAVSPTQQDYVQGKTYEPLPTATGPADTPYFAGWYTQPAGAGTKVTTTSTVPSQSTLTLYAFYSATKLQSYTVDLNSQWRQSPSQSNPDSSAYDGVYESNSNYNVNNGWAKMYVRIEGYETFSLYIRSYGESNYDYALAFNLDVDVTSNPIASTSGVKAHTRENSQSAQAIEDYTKVEYTGIDGGSHFICIVYRKDGSVNAGNDRGYVLIPKEQ